MPAAPTTLGAIVAVFDASTAGKIAGGDTEGSQGLWVGQVPEQISDQELPFVACIHEGDTPHYNTEVGYYETCIFHFEVYAVGLAAAEGIAGRIKTAFDKPATNDAAATFQIVNARCLQCWRADGKVGYKVDVVGERTSTNELVFRATLNYEMSVSKSL